MWEYLKDMTPLCPKDKNGITLIALVITIIILLILAGVVINLTLGENGIIKIAERAGKNYQNASAYEQNQLEELYSKILVAEDSKVTLTMEQLNNYIDARVAEKTKTIYPDTSKVIATIEKSTSESEKSYTATEDCIIMGKIAVYRNGYIYVNINDTRVGECYNSMSGQINVPVYYNLKKGDSIKFTERKDDSATFTHAVVNAYGIK